MIRGVNSSNRYITVAGGSPQPPYINTYSNPTAHGVGNVRYNVQTNLIEIYDGNNWLSLQAQYATVELTPETESLLEWARGKRSEERNLAELMDRHPGLKEAYERLEIMKALTLEEEKVEQK